MSQVAEQLVICDECGGIIPASADRISGVNGTLVMQGTQQPFHDMDFCCSAHIMAWLQAKPNIDTPDPPYSPPPPQ